MKIGNLEVYGVIYKITNKVNGKVYIGQTTIGFDKRYNAKGIGAERVFRYHVNATKRGVCQNKHLLRAFYKYGITNFEVNPILDVAFSQKELDIKEMSHISIYNSFVNGYNQCSGGQGSLNHIGVFGTDNPASRPVIQLSLDGKFIKKWNYISEASNFLNINMKNISNACGLSKKSSGGFIWMYAEEYDESIDYSYKKSLPPSVKGIVQLSLEGEFIAEYDTIAEASRLTNVNIQNISACANNKKKSIGGFMWVHSDDYDPNKRYKYKNDRISEIVVIESDKSIKCFKTIKETSEYTGCCVSSIRKMLKGENNRIKNITILYKDQYNEGV